MKQEGLAKLGDPFPCKVPHFVDLQINFQLVKDELDKIALAQNLKQRSVRGGFMRKAMKQRNLAGKLSNGTATGSTSCGGGNGIRHCVCAGVKSVEES